MDYATEERFTYSHVWRAGNMVMWDNQATMHRATDFDQRYRRLMRRTTVKGDRPFFSGMTTGAAAASSS